MRIRFLMTLITALLTSCNSDGAVTLTLPLTSTPTETLTLTSTPVTATPTSPTAETTEVAPLRLLIWLPEPLIPVGNEDAVDLLTTQFNEFEASNPNIQVSWRRKRVDDVGGIMSTLRTATTIAPGALPDLTLVRRSDLLLAVQLGLIQPLEGRASSAVLGDIYSTALGLGQVDGLLYGLPYMLETQHLVYRPPLRLTGWSFADVLTRDVPFVFPAGRANGVNDVFLVQYLAALPPDEVTQVNNGELPINEDALRMVLSFYEQARQNSIVMPAVLDFSAPIDYATFIGEGTVLVTSTTYLSIAARGEMLEFAPIPSDSGADVTMLDGWMWVMTTTNAERQGMALQLMNWMMDAQRHGDYSVVVNMLPSQRSTFRAWDDADYGDFVTALISSAYLPLSGSAATRARAMQNALSTVLLGQRTAEEATEDVLSQLGE